MYAFSINDEKILQNIQKKLFRVAEENFKDVR